MTWERRRISILKEFFLQQYTPADLNFYCLFTRQYLIEKSFHLLSPWQLKHTLCQIIWARAPLVEMLLSSFSIAYVGMRRAVVIDYLFCFHILYLTEKWGYKQVYWEANSFLPLPFEPCEKKKYLMGKNC